MYFQDFYVFSFISQKVLENTTRKFYKRNAHFILETFVKFRIFLLNFPQNNFEKFIFSNSSWKTPYETVVAFCRIICIGHFY